MRFSNLFSTAVYLCSIFMNLCSTSMEDSNGVNLGLEFGQNGQIPLFTKIYTNLPLFWKYVGIYY